MASVKRINGKWAARFTWRDEMGKRHYKSRYNFDSKESAELWVADFQLNKKKIDETTLFPAYFKDWYETYKQPSITARTLATYTQLYNVLENSILSKKAIGQITRKDYQLFINTFGKKHAKSTVTKFNALIRACVKDALYDDVIEKDFVHGVSMVFNKRRTLKIEYLNIKERVKLTEYLSETINQNFTGKFIKIQTQFTNLLNFINNTNTF